jgi:peroxiredoxin
MKVKRTKNKNNLNFTMISDQNNELARSLGLVFEVEDKVAEEYKSLGIDLSQSQGNSQNELPMPATFVIGADRKIKYVFADADYTKRAETSDIIEAVK